MRYDEYLRALAVSQQWEPFMTYRVEQETQRLHPHRDLLPTLEWLQAA